MASRRNVRARCPFGRAMFLQPDAGQIAIGAAPVEASGGLGVVLTTYSFFGAANHGANAERVVRRIAMLRDARNLPRMTNFGVLPSLVEEARLVSIGDHEPMDGL